jgi:hypothetical protein
MQKSASPVRHRFMNLFLKHGLLPLKSSAFACESVSTFPGMLRTDLWPNRASIRIDGKYQAQPVGSEVTGVMLRNVVIRPSEVAFSSEAAA